MARLFPRRKAGRSSERGRRIRSGRSRRVPMPLMERLEDRAMLAAVTFEKSFQLLPSLCNADKTR